MLKYMVRFACWATFASSALAGQTRAAQPTPRLYVEPFVTHTGSEKLREDVIGELRKINSISLVSRESTADEILGGGGAIWIKGYRSLNPRSGPLPSNGTPVYAGFLSVELKDNKGETLWSYLATPAAESADVSKDLSKRIAKQLATALEQSPASFATAALAQNVTSLKGAGATFPYPVYAKWFTNYRRQNPNLAIDYDSVGSEAGVRRLLAGDVDFGAS